MMSKRRLFVVRRNFGGAGGAERVAADYARRIDGNWESTLVHAGSAGSGIPIGGNIGPSWFRMLKFTGDVDRFCKKVSPACVFSLERGPLCDVFRAGDGTHRRWIRIKYSNLTSWMFNPSNWVNLSLERRSITLSRVIIANSQMVASDLQNEYPNIDRSKIRVIRNGFDPNRFHLGSSNALESIGLPMDAKTFLFLGSGWQRKGLDFAMSFFAAVIQTDKVYRKHGYLLVAGDGDVSPYLAKADQLGIKSRVIFLGLIAEPANFCRASVLMVLPTQYDPFSNASLEALACGCPVFTTSSNGAAEVIDHGRTGLVFDHLHKIHPSLVAREFLETTFTSRENIAESVSCMTREIEISHYLELFEEILEMKKSTDG